MQITRHITPGDREHDVFMRNDEKVPFKVEKMPKMRNIVIVLVQRSMEHGRLVPTEHEMLHMTASVNHDVVDGSPATRALRFLADAFNDAIGLDGIE